MVPRRLLRVRARGAPSVPPLHAGRVRQQGIDKLMNDTTGTLIMLGPVLDPTVAADLSRRLPHLGLRIAEHSRRASPLRNALRT